MADGPYRFHQPGAGPIFFQPHELFNPPQRPFTTASPTAQLLKLHPTASQSPSDSPPSLASFSRPPFNMYQGQHVMMNGQSHQRFGMPMAKFQQHPAHQHHVQAHHPHHPHAQHAHPLGHQHNFSAGALSAASAPHFAPGHLQNGISAAAAAAAAAGAAATMVGGEDTSDEPLSEHWQQQLQMAAESRQANSPHFWARSVAQQSKGIQITPLHDAVLESKLQDRNRPGAVSKPAPSHGWMALDFGGQGLRALSPALFQYTFLDKLYLSHNKLKVLPAAIGQLKNLTHLDVSGNDLTELPPEIGMITTLKKLLAFDNHLQSLPYEMGYLYQLEVLGIEGNLLPDVLKSRIMREGTRALVRHLREELPPPPPPPDRDWIVLDEKNANQRFTIFTYNTLCDNYATPQQYPYTPSRALSWEYRRDLLLNEIRNGDADIVALQEVNFQTYNSFFRENLAYNDYKSIFFQKTRAQGMPEEEARMVDGCALFYKSSKYILIEKHVIHFGQTAVRRPDSKGQDDVYNRLWQKDNIAVVAFLENRLSGDRLIVVNPHIFWNPAFKDVKLIQVAIMMQEVTELANKFAKIPPLTDKTAFRFSQAEDGAENRTPAEPAPSVEYTHGSQIPLIVCGDFNSTPDSAVHDLMAGGRLLEEHPDLENRLYGNLSRSGMTHPFNLRSAYATIGELDFTNYTAEYVGVVDYIWHSSLALQVTGLLGGVDRDYIKRVPGFPNYHFPSDHINLMAEFAFKRKKPRVEADSEAGKEN